MDDIRIVLLPGLDDTAKLQSRITRSPEWSFSGAFLI